MSKLYKRWRDFPLADWCWSDFSPQEMACRGTGKLMIDKPYMNVLHTLRSKLGISTKFGFDYWERATAGL